MYKRQVLGHEGGCEVVECGPGVKGLKPGDHVIPLYIPECGECEYCRSTKSNLCQSIAATVWTGYMPDPVSYTHLDVYKRQV